MGGYASWRSRARAVGGLVGRQRDEGNATLRSLPGLMCWMLGENCEAKLRKSQKPGDGSEAAKTAKQKNASSLRRFGQCSGLSRHSPCRSPHRLRSRATLADANPDTRHPPRRPSTTTTTGRHGRCLFRIKSNENVEDPSDRCTWPRVTLKCYLCHLSLLN